MAEFSGGLDLGGGLSGRTLQTAASVRGPVKVLFVTSELAGYIKAGGLGEVSEALPRALGELCDVRILLPGYRAVRARHPHVDVVRRMPGSSGLPPWSLGRVRTENGLCLYLVLCDELYDREGTPYGPGDGSDFGDNDVRFARLSLAAAEIAAGEADPNWKPDILHANDWPSALSIGYATWKGLDTSSIFTIHNLAYQGLFDPNRMSALSVPAAAFSTEGVEFHGKMSFLKAGIFYASRVTTVSENYAREITTAEHGCGLDGLLRKRMENGDLVGILNGIDPSWPQLARDGQAEGSLEGWKSSEARRLREAFGLEGSDGPLFAIVSRLVHQKGIDLSIEAADMIVKNGGQLIVTGTGAPEMERAVKDLADRNPGAVSARLAFNDEEARGILAGSDFLLMPSRFEPCGLSQMYAQTLGSLPIGHSTGGLVDTIDDGRSGFLFTSCSALGLKTAISRALATYRVKPRLDVMRRHASAKRYDWENSAPRYLSTYKAARA